MCFFKITSNTNVNLSYKKYMKGVFYMLAKQIYKNIKEEKRELEKKNKR